jgi:hypothetical protein
MSVIEQRNVEHSPWSAILEPLRLSAPFQLNFQPVCPSAQTHQYFRAPNPFAVGLTLWYCNRWPFDIHSQFFVSLWLSVHDSSFICSIRTPCFLTALNLSFFHGLVGIALALRNARRTERTSPIGIRGAQGRLSFRRTFKLPGK